MSADQRAEGVKRVSGLHCTHALPSQNDFAQLAYTVCTIHNLQRWQAMAAFVDEVDKTALRPLQKQGFLCGADCCDRARTQEDLQAWYDEVCACQRSGT